jgi:hypothetical protein
MGSIIDTPTIDSERIIWKKNYTLFVRISMCCVKFELCYGWDHLTMSYFDNLDNEFSNKYEKILKIEKTLWICSSTYRLMVIQISCNFIIV